jgi:hypothetical protein
VAVQLGADVLRSALATLERRDPQTAAHAEEAVESLAWRESKDEPLVFGQHALQLRLVAGELAAGSLDPDVGLAVALTDPDALPEVLDLLAAAELHSLLAPFAGVTGRLWERMTLTDGGRILALAVLRARATGPRHIVW